MREYLLMCERIEPSGDLEAEPAVVRVDELAVTFTLDDGTHLVFHRPEFDALLSPALSESEAA